MLCKSMCMSLEFNYFRRSLGGGGGGGWRGWGVEGVGGGNEV